MRIDRYRYSLSAKVRIWKTTVRVRRLSARVKGMPRRARRPSGRRRRLSMATSVPAAPMATPTSAVASAGASLTPSPTIAVRPASFSFVITADLVLGRGDRRGPSSTPQALADGRAATRRLSPVEHGDALDAEFAQFCDHGGRFGANFVGDGDETEVMDGRALFVSENFADQHPRFARVVEEVHLLFQRGPLRRFVAVEVLEISNGDAARPDVGADAVSRDRLEFPAPPGMGIRRASFASATMARATGCSLRASTAAASQSSSSFEQSACAALISGWRMTCRRGHNVDGPSVSVPVLSKATMSTAAAFSR